MARLVLRACLLLGLVFVIACGEAVETGRQLDGSTSTPQGGAGPAGTARPTDTSGTSAGPASTTPPTSTTASEPTVPPPTLTAIGSCCGTVEPRQTPIVINDPLFPPTQTPSAGGDATPLPISDAAVDGAVKALAKRTEVNPATIDVVSVKEQEWSDTSLGCPQPGMAYAEVITPGYLVVLRAAGKQYHVHTDKAGRAVVCDNPGKDAGTGSEGNVEDADQKAAVTAARRVVMQAASPKEMEVVSVEEREWSDSSIGCPKPGMSYLQVITPGYLIVIRADGKEHNVHTDKHGRAVICTK